MLDGLTYLQFHAVFVLPPLAVLAVVAVWRYRRLVPPAQQVGVFLLVVALAVGYTTPWDNFLIGRGVWAYGTGRLAGRLWRAPLGEYLFFVLQPAVATLWLAQFSNDVIGGVDQRPRDVLLGLTGGFAVALVGVLAVGRPETFYLGAILAWASPVLALQWAVGWRYLWRVRRRVAAAVLVPTAYLAAVDGVAITSGLWTIADRYTTGLAIGAVPIEEVLFFLVTTLFVVQALVLFPWVRARVVALDLFDRHPDDLDLEGEIGNSPRRHVRRVVQRWR